MNAQPKPRVRRFFHRNGVLEREEHFLRQKLHGRRRVWFRNGQVAEEEFYKNGLLHGVCRQWNKHGRLLGSYRMTHGAGVIKRWHENGRLNIEFSMLAGKFYGRNRLWARDGTLISDDLAVDAIEVTPEEYAKAAQQNPHLPKVRGRVPKNRFSPSQKDRLLCHAMRRWLMRQKNNLDAKTWLAQTSRGNLWLGHFKDPKKALAFVESLYKAGAVKVIATDIYRSKRGDEFSDNVIVKLPESEAQRRMIRELCARMMKRMRGCVAPENDTSEDYVVLTML